MSNILNIQTEISAREKLLAVDQQQVLKAAAVLRKAEQQVLYYQRFSSNDHAEAKENLAFWKSKKEEATANLASAQKLRSNNRLLVAGLAGELWQAPDPEKELAQLEDDIPLLLFPLRLETRFKIIDGKHQLWLRIYPDDCQVVQNRSLVSVFEWEHLKIFWTEWWVAGGHIERQRAAWRALAASFGTGRAEWLMMQPNIKPLNASGIPKRKEEEDINLVIPVTALPSSAEINTIALFWENWWKADGDSALQQACFQELVADIGAANAENVLNNLVPHNIDARLPEGILKTTAKPKVYFLQLPLDTDLELSPSSWSEAATVNTLPDYFTILGYNANEEVLRKFTLFVPPVLAAGVDPSLPENEQMKQNEEGVLSVNEDLAWITDFEKAISVGMGIKIDLNPQQYEDGFEKLVVVGIKFSSNATAGAEKLTKLIENHYYSKAGFELLKQGTPTNNTEDVSSGYSTGQDADLAFDRIFLPAKAPETESDPFKKTDGQWLAEMLGISFENLAKMPNSLHTDQADARAMNLLLWPATLGYFMDEMMEQVFTDEDVRVTRSFFTRYVSGRGGIPAVRIGKQPYGILPATRISALTFMGKSGKYLPGADDLSQQEITRIASVIQKLDDVWEGLLGQVAYVGKKGPGTDPHQVLLDVLALHPGSVEFHQRYFQSREQLFNQVKLSFGEALALFFAELTRKKAETLLEGLGIEGLSRVPILGKLMQAKQHNLTGGLVDVVPESETEALLPIAEVSANYLNWLSGATMEDIRLQKLNGGKQPTALLYLFARHSLLEEYLNTGLVMKKDAGLIQSVLQAKKEPLFFHISAKTEGESKYAHLLNDAPSITGPGISLADHIDNQLLLPSFAHSYLSRMRNALANLSGRPTAQLSRLFTEHIDSASYRLDAWQQGLVRYRMEEQRKNWRSVQGETPIGEWQPGIYIGGYGYLEQVKSEQKLLTPYIPSKEEATQLGIDASKQIFLDASNAGHISTPSLNHATAAAILRNAYITHNDGSTGVSKEDNPFTVNLSSERVRLALDILEGIRNGQPLGAMLGYRFERGLHDRSSLTKNELNVFIYPIRLAFPLVSENMQETVADTSVISLEQIEARNVLDGLKLISHIKKTGIKKYPFGLPTGSGKGKLPEATEAQGVAINNEVDFLFNVNDAVADLLMAESVYQVVMGNMERSAANADVLGKGAYPPETEIIKTPSNGINLTHRVAIHFDISAVVPVAATPRAVAEPGINQWLGTVLPALSEVMVYTEFSTDDFAIVEEIPVSMADLELQPSDLIYLVGSLQEQAMTLMDDLLQRFVFGSRPLHPNARVRIQYSKLIAGKITLFELRPLLGKLYKMVATSKPLTPAHLVQSTANSNRISSIDIDALQTKLTDTRAQLELAISSLLNPLLVPGPSAHAYAMQIGLAFKELSLFGFAESGSGNLFADIKMVFDAIQKKLIEVKTRWDSTGVLYAGVVDLNALITPPDQSLDLWMTTVEDFVINIFPTLDLAIWDVESMANNLDRHKKMLHEKVLGWKEQVIAFKKAAEKRLAAFDAAIGALAGEKSAEALMNGLLDAGKLLLGEGFRMLPVFNYSTAQAQEFDNAKTNSTGMLNLLKAEFNRFSPLDDWLYGLGRVRDKMNQLENAMLLSEALQPVADWTLTPMQFPFYPGDHWLAMDIPETFIIQEDKLLYTAIFANSATSGSSLQCGILLDEWTETLPVNEYSNGKPIPPPPAPGEPKVSAAFEHTTGITFHYDKPNTEPPQTWLLITPSVQRGHWVFADVYGAILDTMHLAKKRAIDPGLIDQTPYAQLLPATMMAVTLYMITLSTNLAVNNLIYQKIKAS